MPHDVVPVKVCVHVRERERERKEREGGREFNERESNHHGEAGKDGYFF